MPENNEYSERGERFEAELLHQDLQRLFTENEAVVGTGKIMLALISGTAQPDEDSGFTENVLVMNSIENNEVAYNVMMHDNEKPDEEASFVIYPNRTVHLMPNMPEASLENIETLRYIVSLLEVDNIVAQALIDDITKQHKH